VFFLGPQRGSLSVHPPPPLFFALACFQPDAHMLRSSQLCQNPLWFLAPVTALSDPSGLPLPDDRSRTWAGSRTGGLHAVRHIKVRNASSGFEAWLARVPVTLIVRACMAHRAVRWRLWHGSCWDGGTEILYSSTRNLGSKVEAVLRGWTRQDLRGDVSLPPTVVRATRRIRRLRIPQYIQHAAKLRFRPLCSSRRRRRSIVRTVYPRLSIATTARE